jgi:apolipoprotein N-acyltransferase
MPLQLIPFPIAIFFALVFVAACLAVLWKLRKTGKIYSILFMASLVAVFWFLIGVLYTIITNVLA